jgi:hypothetical protein
MVESLPDLPDGHFEAKVMVGRKLLTRMAIQAELNPFSLDIRLARS